MFPGPRFFLAKAGGNLLEFPAVVRISRSDRLELVLGYGDERVNNG